MPPIIKYACRYFGSRDVAVVPEPEGSPHHARLVCSSCDRTLRWLPRPDPPAAGPSRATMSLAHRRERPCVLAGSEKQCRFARSIRERMIYTYQLNRREDIVALLKCITSASWFLANDPDRRPAPPRWPTPEQLEPARPSGECPACHGPLWQAEAEACSYECVDRLAAALRH
jgi:hypothetical protein